MATETMRVLVVEPEKRPMVREIETGLEPLQKAVGGSVGAACALCTGEPLNCCTA